MFDFSFSELVLVGLIALIVLGPERLPEVARALGRWTAQLRRFIEDVKRDIDYEVQDDNLAAFRKVQEELAETRSALEQSTRETFSSLGASLKPDEPAVPMSTAVVEPGRSEPAVPEAPRAAAVRKAPARKRSSHRSPSQPKTESQPPPPRPAGPKTTRNSHGGTKKSRSR
ncbi:MAG: Sec-independent protein translocase protein TatB [Acidiferrobacterales bacterium]